MWEIITILWICYIILFGVAFKIKDNSIVDIFWWLWFLVISILLVIKNQHFWMAQILTFLLILTWSLRIALSIWLKKIKKPWEDKRYGQWRTSWKYFYLRSFLQIYVLQMILMLGVSLPLFMIFSWEGNNMVLTIIWSLIAVFWLSYETIADKQLKAFLQNRNRPKNTIFTGWLWSYSRHPNYLWELVFWLWVTLISLQYSFYWIFWLLLISVLLLFVSWIPMKEKSYKTKLNAETYLKNTPIFIPNFFKK